MKKMKNWSGNVQFSASAYKSPGSVKELQSIIKKSKKMRVAGTRHSFNNLADTTGTQVSLEKFKKIECCEDGLVTIGAGVTYIDLIEELKKKHMAISNFPSLPHLNIIGSIVTGTHGGAPGQGIMATMVVEFTFVDESGLEVTIGIHEPHFDYFLVSLGYLGVITEAKLRVEPSFDVLKCVYQHMSFEDFVSEFKDLMSNKDYVSFFTDYSDYEIDSLWFGYRLDDGHRRVSSEMCPLRLHNAELVLQRHPVPGRDGKMCTKSGRGSWSEKIFHFKAGLVPSSGGDELQSEIFVPRGKLLKALLVLFSNASVFKDLLQISEIRPVSSDEFPLSPGYRQDVFAIHFTWVKQEKAVRKAIRKIQGLLGDYIVAVHWGKILEVDSAWLLELYKERLTRFVFLTKFHNQKGKFLNRFYKTYFGPIEDSEEFFDDL